MWKWIILVMAVAGCSSKLETGYTPNRLSMTPTQRRGLYADPFSPDAVEAQNAPQVSTPAMQHRPGEP